MSSAVSFKFDTSGQIQNRLIIDYNTTATITVAQAIRMDQQVAFTVEPVVVNPSGSATLYSSDFLDTDQYFLSIGLQDGEPTAGTFDLRLLSAAITSSSVANPTVITTPTPHYLASGNTVYITGHAGSTPSIGGSYVATVTSANTFTIPVNVSVGGTGGFVYLISGTTSSDLRGLAWNISNAALQVPLNNALTQLGLPNGAVTELETGVFKIIGSTNGAIPSGLLVADPTALDPECSWNVSYGQLGSSTTPFILILTLRQSPMVFANPTTLLPAASVNISTILAGSSTTDQILGVNLTNNAYGGTFNVTATIPDVANARTITGNTLANPTVVTTSVEHGYATGNVVSISGSNSTPSINGSQTVTVIDSVTFSVPVNVTVAGTSGSCVKLVTATCGVASPNVTTTDFSTILANHPLIVFNSTSGTPNNIAVTQSGDSFQVQFIGTLGLSALPSLAVANINLAGSTGLAGVLNFNTIPLYEYSLGQGTTFQVALSIYRIRVSGEQRTVFGPTPISIIKDNINPMALVPVALPTAMIYNPATGALISPSAIVFFNANFETWFQSLPISLPGTPNTPWNNGGTLSST